MAETFNSVDTKLTTTGLTTVYQAPNLADSNRSVILSCMVCNVDGTNGADITIIKTDASDNELARWVSTVTVPADASLEVVQNKKILKRGQKLRAQASAANDLDITVDVLEIT